MSDAPETRPCPDCASPVRAANQSFCDGCGAFLRWDAPAQAPRETPEETTTPLPAVPPEPTPVREPEPRPVREAAPSPGTPTPVRGTAPSPEAPTPVREAEPSPQPPTPERPPARAPFSVPSPSPSPSPDTVARSLLVPVPEDRAPEPAVAAPVLPARPEAARPAVRAVGAAAPVPGGTPCPACLLANAPGRHFCRFCATPMVPERLSAAEGPYAGRRPGPARDRSRWIVRALIAAGVAAVVVGGVFGGPPAARAVQDHFATRVPVLPVSWTASHAAPGQEPKLAGDGYSNTWWGTGYAGDSEGQYLEAAFAEPTDLLSLLITPGSSKNTTQADGQATPRTFDLVVRDASGEVRVSRHRINDGGTQRVDLRVRDALSVRLVLRTAWRAAPQKQVAVAELEFFGRSVT
ncbi:zinc ribbon domain-containing protein [Streptomyces sp. NPDC056529]|uniref:NADase-type glycan-binding domain-containing protein n=1 Tax=Streptomyces sp. NPDC056529 TaxID=3345855 RepID=UPI0036CA8D96